MFAPGGPGGRGRTAEDDQPAAPQPTFVPRLEDQKLAGAVLLWFHCRSLSGARSYRFRCRLKLLNPLRLDTYAEKKTTLPEEFYVYSPYSPWSDAAVAPRTTEFFLRSGGEMLRKASVEVFTRRMGQWVKQRFPVVQGQMIGQEHEAELLDPFKYVTTKGPVDFGTGAVVVDIDFRKQIPAKSGTGTRTTTEMVYQDEAGRLQSCLPGRLQDGKRYKYLAEQAKMTKDNAKNAKQYQEQR